MSRALLLVFALMQAQVVVVLAAVPTTVCPERCADDGPDGRCPPVCLGCPSSSHTPAPAGARVPLVPAARHEPVPCVADRGPAEPEPREILHVPKALRA
jgi:hypothetical protein